MKFFPGLVLAIETSCDETSAAVVRGPLVMSSVVSSQVDLHNRWGGIVPEAAARAHIEAILPVIEEALSSASISLRDVEAIAVANRPGLVGALSVGVSAAKALAFAFRLPLVGVHHLEGHILSPLAIQGSVPPIHAKRGEGAGEERSDESDPGPRPLFESQTRRGGRSVSGPPAEASAQAGANTGGGSGTHGSDDFPFPHVCLTVSGGHTEIVRVIEPMRYEIVGQTLDDAAGEAFDKGARLLGLGYPGGYAIQVAAEGGDPKRYKLPRGLSGDTLDFSFSGLKTAILRLVESEGDRLSVPDAAASIQEAITSVLAIRAVRAAESLSAQALTLVGGVAANRLLRERLARACNQAGLRFYTPPTGYCTDNAAMIGVVGSLRLAAGQRDGWDLDAMPNSPLP